MKISKSFALGMVVCFVAVIALAGVLVFRQSNDNTEPDAQKQISEKQEENITQDSEESEEPTQKTQSTEVKNEVEEEEPVEEPEENVSTTSGNTQGLFFSKTGTLLWPVEGHVLLNYSMDSTVYFPTLDQYKYNPALIIGAEVGDEVLAAERGLITEVTETAETGQTVIVEIGNGYELVYGQLAEVTVSPGEYVEQGDRIGELAEPTKYYSVEGCNLYFQLLKDGEPVNPLEYLDV